MKRSCLVLGCALIASTSSASLAATASFEDFTVFSMAVGEAFDNVIDFESGFTDGQNLEGVNIGGVTLDGAGSRLPIIETGPGSISGSNPVGVFAVEIGKGNAAVLKLTFDAPITYFGFDHIDAGTPELNGISFSSSGSSGNSAAFAGLTFDAADAVTEIFIRSVQGDSTWGLDNLVFGAAPASVPLPAGLPLMLAGIGTIAVLRRKT